MAHAIEAEIDRNYAAFQDIMATLPLEARGQYALLRDQQLEGLFATPGAAERAGYTRFQDQSYSIQLVSDEPIDLGFYSYAVPERQAD